MMSSPTATATAPLNPSLVEEETSYRRRDGKKLTGEHHSPLLAFLKTIFLVLPVWLILLLPTTLIAQAVLAVVRRVTSLFRGGNAPAPGASFYQCPDEVAASLPLPGEAKPLAERQYDVVLLGATGFTGGLAARYLAKQYTNNKGGEEVKWAIAGRRLNALEALRGELLAVAGDECSEIGVIVCDTSKPETLVNLVNDTRVVATTAGPFDRYGTPVVHMCAAFGTGYVDITGESDWVRQMIDKYDDLSKETGARIVHFCGHDCVPWDLMAMKVAEKLSADHGQSMRELRCFDEINGAPSGGTLETVFHSLEARVRYRAALGFDPLLKSAEGEAGPKTTAKNQGRLGYSSENGTWVGPFVMAMVMANCVRRSNAVNGWSSSSAPPLVYREAVVYPGFMAGFNDVVGMLVFGTALFNPPLKSFLRRYVLPKPGQGPSEARMDHGFLQISCVGVGDEGAKVKATIYFPTDPGYRDTARMLVESALALALDGDKIKVGGGVWTPACCQGNVLLDRLLATGTEFAFN